MELYQVFGIAGMIACAGNIAFAINDENWSAVKGWLCAFLMTLAWVSK